MTGNFTQTLQEQDMKQSRNQHSPDGQGQGGPGQHLAVEATVAEHGKYDLRCIPESLPRPSPRPELVDQDAYLELSTTNQRPHQALKATGTPD